MKNKSNNKRTWDLSFILILGFATFEFIRPQDTFAAIGAFKFPMLLTIAGLILFIRGDKKGIFKETPVVLIMLFIGIMSLSYFKAINHYAIYKNTQTITIFFIAFLLPFLQYVNTKERIILFFKAWVLINFIFALFVIYNGGVGTGGFNKDENDAALVLNTALPFAFYFALSRHSVGKMKVLFWTATVLIAFAVIITFSRGGFLGMVAVGLLIFAQSKNKMKTMLISSLAGILLFAIGNQFIPPEYYADIQSIGDTKDKTRNERFYSWDIGIQMFKRNPVLGVGAGNYPWTVSHYAHYSSMYDPNSRSLGGRAAHSIYFTLIPELGLLGMITFFSLIYQTIHRLRYITKEYGNLDKEDPHHDFLLLAKAAITSIITYLITGAFISVLYYPIIWFYCIFSLGIYRVLPIHNTHKNQRKPYA